MARLTFLTPIHKFLKMKTMSTSALVSLDHLARIRFRATTPLRIFPSQSTRQREAVGRMIRLWRMLKNWLPSLPPRLAPTQHSSSYRLRRRFLLLLSLMTTSFLQHMLIFSVIVRSTNRTHTGMAETLRPFNLIPRVCPCQHQHLRPDGSIVIPKVSSMVCHF